MKQTYAATRKGYANLWEAAQIRPKHRAATKAIVERLAKNLSQYQNVAVAIGCPWWFVAIIHQMESGGDFKTHLHNGDPLAARTRQVPAGRPVAGFPPFTWTESALDALTMKQLEKVPSWETPRCLYEWERYNGWGYFGKINSPYVWSFTTLYDKGKYVADHVFDANAVSKQCGAAAMLKMLIEMGKTTGI